jgi:hypothetical protein
LTTPASLRPSHSLGELVANLGRTSLLFGCAILVGFVFLAIMFKLQVLHRVDVLFYRGIVLIAVSGLLTFAALLFAAPLFRATPSAAFSAAVLSMSINLSFLIVLPVTIDRSISVFLLGYMDQHPTTSFSTSQLRDVFSDTYVDRYQQIERRMDEQLISRNVEQVGKGYRISAQGRAFVTFARGIAWLFDTDPRFISRRDE